MSPQYIFSLPLFSFFVPSPHKHGFVSIFMHKLKKVKYGGDRLACDCYGLGGKMAVVIMRLCSKLLSTPSVSIFM